MLILGIETSCDETAAAVLKIVNCPETVREQSERLQFRGSRISELKLSKTTEDNIANKRDPRKSNLTTFGDFRDKLKIVSNVVSSQIKIHQKYGGIVPEVAARAHLEKIIPVLNQSLNPKPYTLNPNNIDLIAVTSGPGLVTSLLVGVEAAKTLSWIWQKPLLPINHLEGHIAACFANGNSKFKIQNSKFIFPAVCLIVSGGHTELILMKDFCQYQKIGQTLDDAAGECFDKVAKLLDLGYPGGPAIAAEAAKFSIFNFQFSIKLPRPMINTKDFNFSFSGLKTAVLYLVKDKKFQLSGGRGEIAQKMKRLPQSVRSEKKQFIAAVCHEVQQAIIDVLISKTIKAAEKFQTKSVILCGGVASNDLLRKSLKSKIKNQKSKINFFVPAKNLCTDNAAMVAMAGYWRWQRLNKKEKQNALNNWQRIKAEPNAEIK